MATPEQPTCYKPEYGELGDKRRRPMKDCGKGAFLPTTLSQRFGYTAA
jgi:hypothetical protein